VDRRAFDRRVVSERVLDVIRACQHVAPSQLGGGAALSGVHLHHRLSNDVDLLCKEVSACREIVRALPEVARETGASINVVRDAGSFVRASVVVDSGGARHGLELDIVHEPSEQIDSPLTDVDGIVVVSLADLRASKLTCILSRSEPRDLVDLLFLERAGFPPERDLDLAIRKDGGIDPGILAWLLAQFPTSPLPMMIAPLSHEELLAYRDALAERFRSLAVPNDDQ
jgi:hypothetical protein